jgi:hypothetical protein
VKMKGDGNCFFRGISYALAGDQEQFEEDFVWTFPRFLHFRPLSGRFSGIEK